MAAKDETVAPEEAPNREDFSNFALVLKNGQELVCHKIKLAEVSPVFCAMLKQDCVETQTNKMKVTEFERETVESFLDYIYSDLELVKVQDLYKRNFDKKRLTPELLRMCHMYRVKNLLGKCVKHLKNNIEDDNAVDIWTVAETVGNDELKKVALDYFGKKPKELLELSGFEESFQSPQLVKSLVTYMMDRLIPLPTPVKPASDKVITINVKSTSVYTNYLGYGQAIFSGQIRVKLSDTVETLRLKITDSLSQKRARSRCAVGSVRKFEYSLEENRTIESCNLTDGAHLLCDLTNN